MSYSYCTTAPCPDCGGHGEVLTEKHTGIAGTSERCGRCGGLGELPACEGGCGKLRAPGDEELCDNCATNAAEAAYEAKLSDFYGGDRPFTIDEQCRAAYLEKQERRR